MLTAATRSGGGSAGTVSLQHASAAEAMVLEVKFGDCEEFSWVYVVRQRCWSGTKCEAASEIGPYSISIPVQIATF